MIPATLSGPGTRSASAVVLPCDGARIFNPSALQQAHDYAGLRQSGGLRVADAGGAFNSFHEVN